MQKKEYLSQHLAYHVKRASSYSPFQEVLHYATSPAGKLFRPLLAFHLYEDLIGQTKALELLQDPNSNLSLICSSLEIHHAYTLVHDDLPSMDDDDMRRGKPSTHKKFGEWRAILTGDALLHLSHHLLTKMRHPHGQDIQRFFSWALGARGLILGQVYDLGGVIGQDFDSLLRTHELKTGRLIQCALVSSYVLSCDKPNFSKLKHYLRLGKNIGLIFQLLDDLSECNDELSEHEQEVSPFLHFSDQAIKQLSFCLSQIKDLHHDHPQTDLFIKSYLDIMKNKISQGFEHEQTHLYKNLGKDFIELKLRPVMSLF